jgi:predicted nucleic acid-binding protein
MSGTKWLLDTNVVIGLLKQQAAAISLIESQQFDLSRAAVSQITRMELLGFPNLADDEEGTILTFLQNCQVLLIDEAVEHLAIHLRRTSHCKLPDAIIAATAQVHQLTLLTLDERLAKLTEQFNDSRKL